MFDHKNDLSKIKDRTYAKKLDESKSIGTHLIALYVNGNNVVSFDSFGFEHIPKEIGNKISQKIFI